MDEKFLFNFRNEICPEQHFHRSAVAKPRKLVFAPIHQRRYFSRGHGKFLVLESLFHPDGFWRSNLEIFLKTRQLVYRHLLWLNANFQFNAALLSDRTSGLRGILPRNIFSRAPTERQKNSNETGSIPLRNFFSHFNYSFLEFR